MEMKANHEAGLSRREMLIGGGAVAAAAGLPHGMCTTMPDVVNADLLAFFKA
jgi:hypothetical protein